MKPTGLFRQIKSPEEIKALVSRYLQSEKDAKEVVMETVGVEDMFKRQVERQTRPLIRLEEEVKGNIKELENQLKALPEDIQKKLIQRERLLPLDIPLPELEDKEEKPQSNIVSNIDGYVIDDFDVEYKQKLNRMKYEGLRSLKEYFEQAVSNYQNIDEKDRQTSNDIFIFDGQSTIFGKPITFVIHSDDKIECKFGNTSFDLTKGLIILIIDPIYVKKKKINNKAIYDNYVTISDANDYYDMGGKYMQNQLGNKSNKWKYVLSRINVKDDDDVVDVVTKEPLLEEPSPIKGKGYTKWNPYKMKIVKGQGLLGNIQIDLPNLQKGRVVARLGGSVLMDKKVDKTFIDLLTKRYNPKGIYTPKAIKTFKELVTKSGLPIEGYSKKLQILFPEVMPPKEGGEIRFVSSLDELVERMNVLLGALHAGHNGSAVKNEIKQILDILLNNSVITKKFLKNIYSTYLKE